MKFDDIDTSTEEGRMLKIIVVKHYLRSDSVELDSVTSMLPSSKDEVTHMELAGKRIQTIRRGLQKRMKKNVDDIMKIIDAKDSTRSKS